MDKNEIIKAGKIAVEVKKYAREILKKDVSLLEIAEKVESKIFELGGKPAFPVNLSIDNIAAHYTPSHDDKSKARGLLKVDFGVHIDGWIADTSFSVDLEDNEENKKLVIASEKALENASKKVNSGIKVGEIGKVIQETIEDEGFSPIVNLSGHQINHYELHSGVTIPNIDDNRNVKFEEGLYAIEPFTSTGLGRVHDGKPSGIYELISEKNVRSTIAREVLSFIIEEYKTLPFCSRWLFKKFGAKTFFALRQLEENGNLRQFNQLVEIQNAKVSQAENTFLIEKDKVTVITQ